MRKHNPKEKRAKNRENNDKWYIHCGPKKVTTLNFVAPFSILRGPIRIGFSVKVPCYVFCQTTKFRPILTSFSPMVTFGARPCRNLGANASLSPRETVEFQTWITHARMRIFLCGLFHLIEGITEILLICNLNFFATSKPFGTQPKLKSIFIIAHLNDWCWGAQVQFWPFLGWKWDWISDMLWNQVKLRKR